jgi:two-component system sensor histidine kinase GlrK
MSYRVLRVSSLAALLTLVACIFISIITTRSINRSLKRLKKRTRDLASGKFEKIDDIVSPPEIRELADDFNRMSLKLKELDELKMDFISHVSHELRTPLTAIREASAMLLDDRFKKSPEQQGELLKITHEECERLIEAVNKILDLSKIESGMMDYRFEKDNVIPLVQKTVLKLVPIAHSKGIDLVLNPVPELPDVLIDGERIGNVLENLIGNALKYTQADGEVSINISHIKNNKDDYILVSVIDNGPGIAVNNQDSIFEKFRRGDSVEGIVKGTGLGLSIARHIITEHGGNIWVESEPGKGSIFSFTLPVQ